MMNIYTLVITTVAPDICCFSFWQLFEHIGVHVQLPVKLYWMPTNVAKTATNQDKHLTRHNMDSPYTSIATQVALPKNFASAQHGYLWCYCRSVLNYAPKVVPQGVSKVLVR